MFFETAGLVTKIYFTHDDVRGNQRRGFTQCSFCNCIKYAVTSPFKTREEFCVAINLWHVDGVQSEAEWSDHLKRWPSEEQIALHMPRAQFEQF